MKRLMCIVLALTMVLLCGCESAGMMSDPTASQTEGTTEEATGAQLNVTEIVEPDFTVPRVTQPTAGGEPVTVGESGCVRVDYTTNISNVRYITSADQLPDNEALAGYDEAYFETGALVIVMESVSSGSVKVSIESVEAGVVTLGHEMSGDVGTTDMATWLLWAEVEQGLDYEWSVANPALPSNVSAY